MLATFPAPRIAADQDYRSADVAIDVTEDTGPPSGETIASIVALFGAHGATVKVSSIHVNGRFGDYDKLSSSRRLLAEAFLLEMDDELERIVFVGDSPNDGPMFGYFPHSVGLANVWRFTAALTALPSWVTEAEAAVGFVELAAALLEGR